MGLSILFKEPDTYRSMATLFISHSSHDESAAHDLEARLEERKLSSFFLDFDQAWLELRSATRFTRRVLRSNLRRFLKRKKQNRWHEAAPPREPVTLILLDVVMPEMNGFEVCDALRATEVGKRLPIILLTGQDDVDTCQAGMPHGVP